MRRRYFLSTLFSALFALAAGSGRQSAANAQKRGNIRIVDGWLLKEEDL